MSSPQAVALPLSRYDYEILDWVCYRGLEALQRDGVDPELRAAYEPRVRRLQQQAARRSARFGPVATPQRQSAREFLHALLKERRWLTWRQIAEVGATAGHSEATLRRARWDLQMLKFHWRRQTLWRLPNEPRPDAPDTGSDGDFGSDASQSDDGLNVVSLAQFVDRSTPSG